MIINNHNQTKPSYRDVVTSRSDQPSAVKDHSRDVRSTGSGFEATNDKLATLRYQYSLNQG